MKRANSTHDANGTAHTPKRTRKKPAQPDQAGANQAHGQRDPATQQARGRLASELDKRQIQWLLSPWFPRGMLSMVIGLPSVGKSTFMAWLMAEAKGAVILPGFEEVPELTTIQRLEVNGAKLHRIRFLDDREYRLPRDKALIVSILRGWQAELLVLDPIDSYMEDELSENTGRDVRSLLESASWIAAETGAAVVGVRHPGKDRTNVMPGSRQWRAVPRSIVELTSDGGVPPRFMVRHYKDSLGQDARPREYRLEGNKGQPKKFLLRAELDMTVQDLAMVANDPSGRRKVLEAARLIRHLFETAADPLVTDLVNSCRTLGIGEHARDEAKRLLGIKSDPPDFGDKWVMRRTVKDWPSWLTAAETT